jgi:hypothetical protein
MGSSSARVGVAGLTASALISGPALLSGVTVYLVTGGGAYYLYEHPSVAGAVRPDVSLGAGVTVQVASRSQVFLETRYHRLLGSPSQPTWLAPVTLGIRF